MNKEQIPLWDKIEAWKYPLLILVIGILLMLIPTAKKQEPAAPGTQEALAAVLSSTKGVGEAKVLLSEHGAVIVCAGAQNASVKLDIIRAVHAYTGFGSDKITILKLKN